MQINYLIFTYLGRINFHCQWQNAFQILMSMLQYLQQFYILDLRDMGPLVGAHTWRLRNDVQLYPGEASDFGVSHKQLLNWESNTAGKQDKGPCTRLLEEQETLTVVSEDFTRATLAAPAPWPKPSLWNPSLVWVLRGRVSLAEKTQLNAHFLFLVSSKQC